MFQPGQDVFQTQADDRFNSFSSPLNGVNTNGGGWGINSAYLTPSYLSPYRPRYQGTNGDGPPGGNPGFFRSANHIFNPFEGGGTNYGGNTYQQNQSYYSAIGMRPLDGVMGAAQTFAIPMAVSMATFSHLAKPGGVMGSRFASGVTQSLMGGAGFGASSTASAMRGASWVGKVAGETALPFFAAQAIVSGVDSAIFDPYIAQRQTSNSLRSNLFGISFGDGNGNEVNGRGLSRSSAARMSANISGMAARDLTFSQKEVSQLTDFSARSGLLDNVSSTQITSKIADITKQVKVIMAVANTSDFKEAIQIISQLQHSGVSSGAMNSTAAGIGGLASAAGMSAQRMMNTVGAQGQYLFQSNGLTPYIGQLTAGQSAASFGSAYRSGLISPALMARMGGVEGATQSANTGMLNMLRSPYSMITGMNAFNGGSSGSVVGNLSQFGGSIAGNPLEGIGKMNLLSPEILSNTARNGGLQQSLNRLREIGELNPLAMKNGKMSAYAAHMLMTQQLGLGEDESRAIINQMAALSDPKSSQTRNAGFDSAERDYTLKFQDQHGLNRGIFTNPINAVTAVGRQIQGLGSSLVGGLIRGAASVSDYVEGGMTGGMYGKDNAASLTSFGHNKVNAIKLTHGRGAGPGEATLSLLSKINDMAASGDSRAQAVISGKGNVNTENALRSLALSGDIDSSYAESKNQKHLAGVINQLGTGTVTTRSDVSAINNRVKAGTGQSDIFTAMEISSLLDRVSKDPTDTQAKKRLTALNQKGFGGSDSDAQTRADHLLRLSTENGTYGLGKIFDDSGAKSREDLIAQYSKNPDGSTSRAEYATKLAKKQGTSLLRDKVSPGRSGYLSDADLKEYRDAEAGIEAQKTQLNKLAAGNFIDTTSYTTGIAALDNKESTLKFSSAVDKFEAAVNNMSAGGGSKPADSPSGILGTLYSGFMKSLP